MALIVLMAMLNSLARDILISLDGQFSTLESAPLF